MLTCNNYIADNVKMAVPPQWWLQRLYDFDSDLVVLPSRERPYAYVLARRARKSWTLTPKAVAQTNSDTGMCAKHKLVRVDLILRLGGGWTIDNILAKLAARDIWRHGGAEKVADAEDAADEAGRLKIKSDIRQDMWHRAGDAYQSYKARTGQRTKLNSPLVKSSGIPSGSTAETGIVIPTV